MFTGSSPNVASKIGHLSPKCQHFRPTFGKLAHEFVIFPECSARSERSGTFRRSAEQRRTPREQPKNIKRTITIPSHQGNTRSPGTRLCFGAHTRPRGSRTRAPRGVFKLRETHRKMPKTTTMSSVHHSHAAVVKTYSLG